MSYAIKLDKENRVDLSDYDPDDTGKADKDTGKIALAELGHELDELQEWLYAAQKHSVLIVLQGLDTSGKDGTIAHVMSTINPQGCDVASFKIPTPLEQAHDFLWRVHQKAPARGMMTIFNRSHYEDVLVTRVHNLIKKDVWEARYDEINNFEKLLTGNDTIILKFFLHISKKEQEERLLAREKDDEKAWKLSPGDWEERQYWKEYQAAYAEALSHTATKHAPWYIVPANHKWFRNLAIAEAIVSTLRPYKDEWQEALKKLG
ncbi:MAG: polyphosphate kinase 2 family protein, partial [Armatimonadetes bacterium]|nr:polyphosphate kinase 2 family protein [Armatimonadota bacterium]